jgi:hypothetical protein
MEITITELSAKNYRAIVKIKDTQGNTWELCTFASSAKDAFVQASGIIRVTEDWAKHGYITHHAGINFAQEEQQELTELRWKHSDAYYKVNGVRPGARGIDTSKWTREMLQCAINHEENILHTKDKTV